MHEGNKRLGMHNIYNLNGNVLLSYITVDFKKVASDLFHAGSTLVESECMKRKRKLSGPKRNNSLKAVQYVT